MQDQRIGAQVNALCFLLQEEAADYTFQSVILSNYFAIHFSEDKGIRAKPYTSLYTSIFEIVHYQY